MRGPRWRGQTHRAKGMAKQEADGYLSWKIEGMPDGAILINGTDLSKIGGAPPSP